ncbi:hypothetical protein [Piscirickettsia litoralis]|nr:hypothetical protein [Piscirickettsia litoralis]
MQIRNKKVLDKLIQLEKILKDPKTTKKQKEEIESMIDSIPHEKGSSSDASQGAPSAG